MTQRKKLIEVALPLEAINEASAREKSIRHGHPSTLHLWWARRPLAAARAVIFSSLVDDPDSPDSLPAFVEACKQLPIGANVKANGDTPRMRLFDFIERLVTWEATTDEAILRQARELIMIATEGNPPPLLDPFAGGGSIPLEAQRLGLEAHASDLNPVAVMINKAQIEIPPLFANMPPVNSRDRAKMFGEGQAQPLASSSKVRRGKESKDTTWKGAAGLAADVGYYSEWMLEKAWEKIGHLYPSQNGETVIAWLWARTVKSPNPAVNAHVPLMSSFIISQKQGKECWAKPIINDKTHEITFEIVKGKPPKDMEGTVNRTGGRCIISNAPMTLDYIRQEGRAGRMGQMLIAIVTEGKNRRNYYAPTPEHTQRATEAHPTWKPETEINHNPRDIHVQSYGLNTYADIFSNRQLVILNTLSEMIAEVHKEVSKDSSLACISGVNDKEINRLGYPDSICVYLAFLIDQLANHQSTMCGWNSTNEQMRNVFSRQSISMTWDYAESNPFCQSSGSFNNLLERMLKGIHSLGYGQKPGIVNQIDATQVNSKTPLIISTDPPYYDNIGYADLSDFFYVWLRRNLGNFLPNLFATMLVPKEPELVATPYRFNGNQADADKHFEQGLLKFFVQIRQIIEPNIPLTVYYAFKQSEIVEHTTSSTGWEKMLEGLIASGFNINGTWPLRTERDGRMLSNVKNALASSIVLVCRPRAKDAPNISRRAFVDALRRELPAALKEMQSGNIAPVDLAQASIGPGMAIYSRYSKVLEADGTAMSVRTALGLINQELDAYLAEQDGDIDGDTRFAVDWFSQFGFDEGEFGQADVLARAKNTSVAGIEAAGVVIAGRGKVKLKHWTEYDPSGWNPKEDKRATVWEATHHLIERLNTHGETGSAMLMTQLASDMAAEARNLAYRLYSICERKGWADHARDYNALVISWAGIGEETARLREAKSSGDAVEQKRLFED
jgi:putative DNA methylase